MKRGGRLVPIVLLAWVRAGVAAVPPAAYVANLGAGSVSVVDTASNRIVATVAVGAQPDGVAASPDGRRIYVANFADDTVTIIDTASNTVTGSVGVGHGPVGLAVAPDGRHLFVADRGDDTVSVLDTAADAVVATIAVGAGPDAVAVTPDGAAVYVTDSFSHSPGQVSVIDTAADTVAATVPVLRNPNRVAISPDGNVAYVTNFRSWNISILDVSTRSVVTTIRVFGRPSGVVASADGAFAYVVTLAGRVQVIDARRNAVVGSVGVGARPFGAAVLGPIGYVANFDSNTLSVVDLINDDDLLDLPVGNQPFAVAVNCVGSACLAAPFTPPPTPSPAPTAGLPATPTPAAAAATPTMPASTSAAIVAGSVSGHAGDQVSLPVVWRSGGLPAAAMQNDLAFAAPLQLATDAAGQPLCAVNPEINKNATRFALQPTQCEPAESCQDVRALVLSLDNVALIPDGALLYTCTVNILNGAAPGTYPVTISRVVVSDPGGNGLPATGIDGQVRVSAASADSPRRARAAAPPGGPMLCAGGPGDGAPCAADADCPQGACVSAVGVCAGGSDDGLLCDCPGAACAAGASCAADASLGTCDGGAAAGQCCDPSFNCAGQAPCVGTPRVCTSGLAKGMPCLSDAQCMGAQCSVSGRLCIGGDFDHVACVDGGDCPRGACLAPGEGAGPPPATPTPTPLVPPDVSAADPGGGGGCRISPQGGGAGWGGWVWLASGMILLRRARRRRPRP